MNCWGTYTRFLVENQILYYFSVFFFTIFSSTNGFQENYDFSFANILPHGVCSAVYHPQHSLLILGSLTGQGQRTSAGLLMWKENQVKKSGFVLIFFLSIVVVLIFVFFLTADEPCPASLYGLTAWRILSGYPHYNLIEDDGTQLIKVTFIFSMSFSWWILIWSQYFFYF